MKILALWHSSRAYRISWIIAYTLILSLGISVLVNVGYAAQPQLFGSNGLNTAFCHDKTFRRTVVYIDYDSVRPGHKAWAENLENKLRATLAPGERLAVVELFPKTGTSRQLWSACWPDYTTAQRSVLSHKTYFFSSNPLNGIKQQQAFFFNGFGAAITQIFLTRAKHPIRSEATGGKPPPSEILETLASDGARFSQSNKLIRAIVYSNGAQNSDIGSITATPPVMAGGAGKTLGTFFRNSVFYFFGIRDPSRSQSSYLANSRKFWVRALSSMDTTIIGYGSVLSIPNNVPNEEYRYRVTLTRKNLPLAGSMLLVTDASGNLIDSTISINRLGVVALSGHFVCQKPSKRDCSLRAMTNRGLVTTDSSETLDLRAAGSGMPLKGNIGVPGAITFSLEATPAHMQ